MNDIFCDYLSVTTPLEYGDSVLQAVEQFLTGFYAERTKQNEYRSSSGGAFYWGDRNGVRWYNSSGRWLEDLRLAHLLPSFLSCFWTIESDLIIPHKVTKLDLAFDVNCNAPADILRVSSLGYSGQVSLTRKAVSLSAVKELLAPCIYSPSQKTGTVYFGRRGYHDVVLRVYDKRQERLSAGMPDIPDTVRYELTLALDGMSLKDVVEPHNLFWSYMCSNLLSKPSYTQWRPSNEPYKLKRPEKLPALKLKHCVQESRELERLIIQSMRVGEKGVDYLCSLIRQRAASLSVTPSPM